MKLLPRIPRLGKSRARLHAAVRTWFHARTNRIAGQDRLLADRQARRAGDHPRRRAPFRRPSRKRRCWPSWSRPASCRRSSSASRGAVSSSRCTRSASTAAPGGGRSPGPADNENGNRIISLDKILVRLHGHQDDAGLARDWEVSDGGKTITSILRKGQSGRTARRSPPTTSCSGTRTCTGTRITPTPTSEFSINGKPGKIEKVDDYTVAFKFPSRTRSSSTSSVAAQPSAPASRRAAASRTSGARSRRRTT